MKTYPAHVTSAAASLGYVVGARYFSIYWRSEFTVTGAYWHAGQPHVCVRWANGESHSHQTSRAISGARPIV